MRPEFQMSPMIVGILLWYYASPVDMLQVISKYPAYIEACYKLCDLGILNRTDTGYTENHGAVCAYVDAVLAVPLPHQKWVVETICK